MRAAIVVAVVACLAAPGSAQESRPTSRPATVAPAPPADKAEPAPARPGPGDVLTIIDHNGRAQLLRGERPVPLPGEVIGGLTVGRRLPPQRLPVQGRILFGGVAQRGVVRISGERIEYAESPLLTGDYASALQALDEARTRLQTASDTDEAFKALEAATKALMDARAALWRQKDAAKKSQKPADAPAVPHQQDGE